MQDAVLILGDSVTVGAGFSGVDTSTAYTTLVRTSLQEAGVEAKLTCSALDGVDTGYALKRFDRMVARHNPDVLVVALGLNDARPPGGRKQCSPERYSENLSRLTEKALEIDACPILATPSPRLDLKNRSRPAWQAMAPYADQVRKVAERYHINSIDLFDDFVGESDLEDLIPDRLHPGPKGHQIIAQAFARFLIPFCRSSSRPGAQPAPVEVSMAGEEARYACVPARL